MKCIASFVILALSSVVSVFARKEVGRYSNGYNYRLYDDNKATLVGTYYDNVNEFTIPAYITANNKRYYVSEIDPKVFDGRTFTKITIDGQNPGIRIKKDAFQGIRGLKEFNIYSRNVDVEIGGFSGVGNYVNFQGVGVQEAVESLTRRLLNKWNLPIGKNYEYVDEWNRMKDLYLLAKNMQRNFGLYDKVAYPDNAANVALIGAGSRDGYARLYRIMAMVMGYKHDQVLVGCDNIHYCWNYVKVNVYEGERKWHVLNALDSIGDEWLMNIAYFQNEKDFVAKTLKPFYGEYYTLKPHEFIIHNDRYNYPGESKYNYLNSENFDSWLSRNNAGKRTL